MGDYVKVSKKAFAPIVELVIIEGRKDEEVFEEWDDFIQWESYEEALRYWTEVEERVKDKVK
jgi:hypothetical protein